MSRPPLSALEKLLLSLLIFQALFMTWQLASGRAVVVGFEIQFALWTAAIVLTWFCAVWFTLRRHPAGLVCCALIFAVQVLQITFSETDAWKFVFMPTVNIELNGDDEYPFELNVVALVMTILSLGAFARRRVQNRLASNPLTSAESLTHG
jgi:hypothetical protein